MLLKSFTNNPSKHSSWWRRTEDVLKTYWRRLQRNIFLSFKTLEDVLKKASYRYILKTSRRSLEDVLDNVLKRCWKRLEDVLRRRFEDVFGRRLANTSWRRLEDVLEDEKLLRWIRLQDVLKTSWKTRNVCWDITFQIPLHHICLPFLWIIYVCCYVCLPFWVFPRFKISCSGP